MNPIVRTIVLLTLSNVFMTFAWYAHLKHSEPEAMDRRSAG